jgi:hypothetical protein
VKASVGNSPSIVRRKTALSTRHQFAVLLLALAGAVNASPLLNNTTVQLGPVDEGEQAAVFGIVHTSAGLFTDTFNFATASNSGSVTASLGTLGFTKSTDIDFINATLNGLAFDFIKLNLARVVESSEAAWFSADALTGPYQLIVTGRAGQGLADGTVISASYAGTFDLENQVPEPSGLTLTLAGLFAVAVARRRRPR